MLGLLREMLQVLRLIGHFTKGKIFEYDADILGLVLVVLGHDLVSRVDPRVALRVRVVGIKSGVSSEELPGLLGGHGHCVVLEGVLHKETDSVEYLLTAWRAIEFKVFGVGELDQRGRLEADRVGEFFDFAGGQVILGKFLKERGEDLGDFLERLR